MHTQMIAKPWGRGDLPPPFVNPGSDAIGEIWFEPSEALNSLLVKYIFTSENLSVQCHPSDAQTLAKGLGRQGKEECWLVIDADPGARIGIGFNHDMTPAALRQSALDGSIEKHLAWHPVSKGDFFYIPANTVHAIGAGISLIEIQQNSDITYRLYDYGQMRELHLDDGIAVAARTTYPANLRRHLPIEGAVPLVSGPHFRLDRIDGEPAGPVAALYQGAVLLIPLDCSPVVSGSQVHPGQCAQAASLAEVEFPKRGLCLIAQPVHAKSD